MALRRKNGHLARKSGAFPHLAKVPCFHPCYPALCTSSVDIEVPPLRVANVNGGCTRPGGVASCETLSEVFNCTYNLPGSFQCEWDYKWAVRPCTVDLCPSILRAYVGWGEFTSDMQGYHYFHWGVHVDLSAGFATVARWYLPLDNEPPQDQPYSRQVDCRAFQGLSIPFFWQINQWIGGCNWPIMCDASGTSVTWTTNY
jgi:hypothetical protein